MLLDANGVTSTSIFLFLRTPTCLHKAMMRLWNSREVCSRFSLVRIFGMMIDPRFNSFQFMMQPTNASLAYWRIHYFKEGIKLILTNLKHKYVGMFSSFFSIIAPSFNHKRDGIPINEAKHALIFHQFGVALDLCSSTKSEMCNPGYE